LNLDSEFQDPSWNPVIEVVTYRGVYDSIQVANECELFRNSVIVNKKLDPIVLYEGDMIVMRVVNGQSSPPQKPTLTATDENKLFQNLKKKNDESDFEPTSILEPCNEIMGIVSIPAEEFVLYATEEKLKTLTYYPTNRPRTTGLPIYPENFAGEIWFKATVLPSLKLHFWIYGARHIPVTKEPATTFAVLSFRGDRRLTDLSHLSSHPNWRTYWQLAMHDGNGDAIQIDVREQLDPLEELTNCPVLCALKIPLAAIPLDGVRGHRWWALKRDDERWLGEICVGYQWGDSANDYFYQEDEHKHGLEGRAELKNIVVTNVVDREGEFYPAGQIFRIQAIVDDNKLQTRTDLATVKYFPPKKKIPALHSLQFNDELRLPIFQGEWPRVKMLLIPIQDDMSEEGHIGEAEISMKVAFARDNIDFEFKTGEGWQRTVVGKLNLSVVYHPLPKRLLKINVSRIYKPYFITRAKSITQLVLRFTIGNQQVDMPWKGKGLMKLRNSFHPSSHGCKVPSNKLCGTGIPFDTSVYIHSIPTCHELEIRLIDVGTKVEGATSAEETDYGGFLIDYWQDVDQKELCYNIIKRRTLEKTRKDGTFSVNHVTGRLHASFHFNPPEDSPTERTDKKEEAMHLFLPRLPNLPY
jgi:hypothetical protein